MADFATKQDLIVRFGEEELIQRTDRVNRPRTTVDDTVVSQALSDASAVASGYVSKVYELPFSAVPPALTKAVCDIARFYLWGNSAGKDGEVERNFEIARSWLKDVSRGLVQLDVEGEPPAQPEGGTVRVVAPERRFTRDSLRNM
ncbi:DUF1320 domain-containing protein [Aurantimonas sp. 22II-16-19i]|uniref:gp436 family protein n=1 Tax=Aurantimonas sp. 22II-16-19i TaxID=1317114 RepID=UPI0009F7FFA4|nr:DUF1320 domain-containing protein [Aurantimonas sp. 22II-16-19i]ORE87816.1 hypothetical protein ATO4_25033 [Aurantimonas sp. 22II-16-19i]